MQQQIKYRTDNFLTVSNIDLGVDNRTSMTNIGNIVKFMQKQAWSP